MTSNAKLAINGGPALVTKPFTVYNSIGKEEKDAVAAVMDTGQLSHFLATWTDNFWGGPKVRELEKACVKQFAAKYAISVNSATSGLYAAMGAFGIGPGDEVIVPPYTMIASVSAAVVWGAVPVFADLDPDTFCISPARIREKITSRTKAIVAVDMFGHPADFDEINKIAKEHNLLVLEDAAQAPGVKYKGRYCGTLADIGVYSLNCHKHVQCGEGGIVFTNDEKLMQRVALIRNHAENVVEAMKFDDLTNMIGQNYRMSELHAAVAIEQYKKLDDFVETRIARAEQFSKRLAKIDGITPAYVQPGVEHAYYIYPMKFDKEKFDGVHRDAFVKAVNAEGVADFRTGYFKPLYHMPMFQKKIAIGKNGFPFTGSDVSYEKGLCPVCEDMHSSRLMVTTGIHGQMSVEEVDLMADAIEKVVENIDELKALRKTG